MRLAYRLHILTPALFFGVTAITVFAQVSTGVKTQQVIARGRAVCLDDNGGQSKNNDCHDAHRFGLVAVDGKVFRFLASDVMTGMFTDQRVRDRELQVTARLLQNEQLEITRIQSIKQGKLYDIFYFCHVCNITAYAPGPCPCCGAEMEFTELPALESLKRAGALNVEATDE
jgi:hypothetical protein